MRASLAGHRETDSETDRRGSRVSEETSVWCRPAFVWKHTHTQTTPHTHTHMNRQSDAHTSITAAASTARQKEDLLSLFRRLESTRRLKLLQTLRSLVAPLVSRRSHCVCLSVCVVVSESVAPTTPNPQPLVRRTHESLPDTRIPHSQSCCPSAHTTDSQTVT